MIRCVFFDRDGTLGTLSDVRYPQTITYFPDARETIRTLHERGIKAMIATNQSSIARGTGAGYDFDGEFRLLGADDWFICPHDNQDGCDCRKPATGLLRRALEKYHWSGGECAMVGDRETDILCGERMGMFTVLLSPQRECTFATRPKAIISSLSELLQVLPTD